MNHSKTTTFPRKSASDTAFPSKSVNVKAGADAPMAARGATVGAGAEAAEGAAPTELTAAEGAMLAGSSAGVGKAAVSFELEGLRLQAASKRRQMKGARVVRMARTYHLFATGSAPRMTCAGS